MSSRNETCPHCRHKMVRESTTRKSYRCRNPKCKGPRKDKPKALWER